MATPDEGLQSLSRHRVPDGRLSDTITERLRSAILNGTWARGSRLPSEQELASALGVSRGTIRKAWGALEVEGLVVPRPGLGTFVSEHFDTLRNNLNFNWGITEVIEQMGLTAGCEELRVQLQVSDKQTSHKLNLPEGTQVVVVERVRTASDKPVAFSVDIFAYSLVQESATSISLDQLEQQCKTDSLYHIFENYFGRPVVDGVAVLRPVSATAATAQRLAIAKDSPLLYIEQVDHDREHVPVLLSHEYHVPDVCTFTVHRRR
jgi:GntR family transcriptional regulator